MQNDWRILADSPISGARRPLRAELDTVDQHAHQLIHVDLPFVLRQVTTKFHARDAARTGHQQGAVPRCGGLADDVRDDGEELVSRRPAASTAAGVSAGVPNISTHSNSASSHRSLYGLRAPDPLLRTGG
ncbi:hypothetical protein [Amycolatopsis sp. WQ 127309]|uniref:hypothetical protein n=1 Tax=Amycolatopsis sp. WQ 127309 TaxID=2932773 RepID=UPI001FF1EFF4|nr:hypothetical protein [Amycolatopsis sp. WQ 127309]UOZ03502.1 hypothetical protein MUY22_32190 [Amycolatopsis sp. WQ 127309]